MIEAPGRVDQVIAGRYRLLEPIGEGGMGCVWRARHLVLGSPVAIKLVRPSLAERPGMRDRFLREAKAAALLRGVHVVQILDHGVDGGAPFIAMEYLEGESLAARLSREGKLSPAATALVMTGVARALGRAHKMGIVHRDLKPDNIFLARDEAGEIVKVLDFGIAKVLGPVALDSQERRSTETGTMLGTPCYMSPEQARGRKEMDTRSDLWSFAVIAFECLTGRRPFDAAALGELMMQICSEPIPKPSSIAPVPRGFDAWFERATQRDPAARFQTVRETSDALAEILTPGDRWVEVTGDVEPAAATGSRAARLPGARRALWPVGIGAAVAVVVGVTVSDPHGHIDDPGVPASALVGPSPSPDTTTVPAASTTPVPASSPEMRRVRLVVLPSDASVEIDGAPARVVGGAVEIAGQLGTVHHARVFKGPSSVEGDVSITVEGAIPAKMDLDAARPQALSTAPPPRTAVSPASAPPPKSAATPAAGSPQPTTTGKVELPRESFE